MMFDTHAPVSHETSIIPNTERTLARGFSKQSMGNLSQPKEDKKIWLTSFDSKMYWGNQNMMWPLSDSTLKARPTKRLMELASAKKNFQEGTDKVNRPEYTYSCGGTSGIWEVKKAPQIYNKSQRIKQLATPKRFTPKHTEHRHEHEYGCGRESPIWSIKEGAKTCVDRPRTAQLAKPKEPHKEYKPSREVETAINPIALRAATSERIHDLALPKYKSNGLFIDSRAPEDCIWKVSPPARAATASPRILELAKTKAYVEGYIPNRSVQWPVSRSARRVIPTPRSSELAKPIVRESMDHLQFNPDAFFVSPRAMKAICTPRIEELANPIKR